MSVSAALKLPVSERDHVRGPVDAPLTLVEYGDYECPHCGRAYPVVKAIERRLATSLRFVFRNFPLQQVHPHAEAAAEAAEAAGAQGRFWEMHDLLYEHQSDLSLPSLTRYAKIVGVDVELWARELDAGTFEDRVREDFMSGARSGVNGTPTFFVNGYRYDGHSDEASLHAALEEAAARHGIAWEDRRM